MFLCISLLCAVVQDGCQGKKDAQDIPARDESECKEGRGGSSSSDQSTETSVLGQEKDGQNRPALVNMPVNSR